MRKNKHSVDFPPISPYLAFKTINVHSGAVAVATLGLFAIMSLIIRASLRQRRPTTFPIGPVTQQERENDSEAGTEGPATSALNRPSKQIPTRVPVVIVEPDATVEVAYALRHDPETGEVPLTARFPTRAPLLRAPTVPRLSLDESGPGVVDSERTPSKTGSKENLPQVG